MIKLSSTHLLFFFIFSLSTFYVNSAVCDTAAKKLKRYCQLTGNQKNSPWLLFFEGNNAYAKYGVFNGILNDPTSGQVKATNPTCTS